MMKLGQGGQAEVFRAVDSVLRRDVVIKWSKRTLPAPFHQELLREGQTLARLEERGLVRVYDADMQDGKPFLVMEYIPGRTLSDWLREHRPKPRDAAALTAQLARTLATVRAQGVLHRDLKPANILMDTTGRPRILDFGLALMSQPWVEPRPAEDQICGTMPYMAPEQAEGKEDSIGPRTDIFGLGAVLYEMLTGRPPYAAATERELWTQIRSGQVASPRAINPRVPRELERICRKALAANAEDRYTRAEEMERALRAYLQRPRRLMAAALAGLMAVVALLLFGLAQRTPVVNLTPRQEPALARRVDMILEIEGYRGNPAKPLGTIGRDCFSLRIGDAVRVHTRLMEPAYGYLIALNPDGHEQLCHPQDEETPPAKSVDLHFPSEGTKGFVITEGTGVQTFVFVTSRQPLPSYRDWESRVGKLPWNHYDSDGIWRFDGRQVTPVAPDRGEVQELALPKPFVDLCQTLRGTLGAEQMEALAFPVKAQAR